MTMLSDNLKYLRTKNNYSQDDIANILFVTHQTISNHETGKSEPTIETLKKYSDLYRINIHDLTQTDISKSTKDPRHIFESVIFDKRDTSMIILDGTKGTYDYRKIKKCEILHEKARYRNKGEPFKHFIVTGVRIMVQANILERPFNVGLKITMKDGTILGIYTSKQSTRTQTDLHLKDYEEAEKIKALVDRIIEKYKDS